MTKGTLEAPRIRNPPWHSETLPLTTTMSTSEPISITVSHRGTAHSLSILPDDLLADVHARLEELTGVPQYLQKLLYKGKSAKDTADKQVKDMSIKDGMKIQLLGSTTKELDEMHAAETEQQRRERILRERALKGSTKVSLSSIHLSVHDGPNVYTRSEQQASQAAKP